MLLLQSSLRFVFVVLLLDLLRLGIRGVHGNRILIDLCVHAL